MSRKNKTYKEIGDGKDCPKCLHPMRTRTHKEITQKQKRALYYFSQWDYCRPCKHIQLYEKFKVHNKSIDTKPETQQTTLLERKEVPLSKQFYTEKARIDYFFKGL